MDFSYELGTVFTPLVDGFVTHLRVFGVVGETGVHRARLWRNRDAALIAGPFDWDYTGANAWIARDIPDVALEAGESYTVSISTGEDIGQWYSSRVNGFAAAGGNGRNLTYPEGGGVYSSVIGMMPTDSCQDIGYDRDIIFRESGWPVTNDLKGWLQRNGLLADGTGLGGASSAPAEDGFENLLKYALGLDPWKAGYFGRFTYRLWTDETAPGQPEYFSLQVTLPDPVPVDLVYDPRGSSDLLSWPTSLIEASVEANGDGTQTVIWRDVHPVSESTRRFLRLNVDKVS